MRSSPLKDEILFEQAYGFANQEEQRPLTPFYRFLIASLSKQVTAALALQTFEARLIDLAVPLATYLPEIRQDWAEVTLHHLLTHSSGIKEWDKPLAFKAGKNFLYNNIGYDLLGTVLERVTGRTFADLSATLFHKCGMNHTISPSTGDKLELQALYKDLATGYKREENSFQIALDKCDISSNPSGGLLSTLHDLHQWNLYLHHGKILSLPTYIRMITPHIMRENRWGEIGYGYGVEVFEKNGAFQIAHNGIIAGYTSTLVYYPQSQLHLIILENESYSSKEWTIEEQKTAFSLHDKIRQIVQAKVM
ncbi:MAG: beta-lactamase family protein [Candidatus Paracaedibacteraceae bacterium]|nr:beta-lactamase family protein [Candidatus Paracaedibacteraceae bacterium]